jgi:hypothetical protein
MVCLTRISFCSLENVIKHLVFFWEWLTLPNLFLPGSHEAVSLPGPGMPSMEAEQSPMSLLNILACLYAGDHVC